ncbi:hypothetical protein HDZ31DRAFT_30647 [Schizophyllum fasciatum]
MSSQQPQAPSSLPLLSDGWIGSRFNLAASHREESYPEHPTQSYPTLALPHPGLPATTALPGYARSSLDILSVWEVRPAASIPIRSSVESSCPINTLPLEVLSQIFLGATGSIQIRDAKPSPTSVSLRLSHVCRYWRGVAIDLPGIWQCLSLTGCKDRRTHRRLDLVKAFMERSKGLGMDIYYQDAEEVILSGNWWQIIMRGEAFTVAPYEDRCFCVLDCIIARIGEIRSLEIIIGHASSSRLTAVSPTAAAMLKSLNVRFLEGGQRTQVLSRFLASLPRVERLVWGNSQQACAVPPPMGVPWLQLVTADIVDCALTHDAFLRMLSQGQRLRQVMVRLSSTPPSLHGSFGRLQVEQSALENLTIYGDGPADAVFRAFRLPSLRVLALRSDSREAPGWPVTDIQALQCLISGIHEGLHSFALNPAENVAEGDLISVLSLAQMSTLRYLEVRLPHISDILFARLNPGYGPPLVPHLETLEVAKCATADGTVSEMILARLQHNHPLRCAEIAFVRQAIGLHPRDLAEFHRFQQLGVSVTGCF